MAERGDVSQADFSPKRFLRSVIRQPGRSAKGRGCVCRPGSGLEVSMCPVVREAAPEKVLWTPHSPVTKTVSHPDHEVEAEVMLPKDILGLGVHTLKKSQDKYAKQRPSQRFVQGRYRVANKDGARWVPDPDKGLQVLLYAAAHQGVSGHRRKKATLQRLQKVVFWTKMEEDVGRWQDSCLQCIKLADGTSIPRPLGTSLVAERPGEILMLDYIDMEDGSDGHHYVLMCVDKFSRLVEFVPTPGPTAIKATHSVLVWGSRYGLPTWIISDGGSHF